MHQHGARGWHGVNVVNEVGAVERGGQGGRSWTQLDAVELGGLDRHTTNPTYPVPAHFNLAVTQFSLHWAQRKRSEKKSNIETPPIPNKKGQQEKFLQKNVKSKGKVKLYLDSFRIEVVKLGVNIFNTHEFNPVLVKVVIAPNIKS